MYYNSASSRFSIGGNTSPQRRMEFDQDGIGFFYVTHIIPSGVTIHPERFDVSVYSSSFNGDGLLFSATNASSQKRDALYIAQNSFTGVGTKSPQHRLHVWSEEDGSLLAGPYNFDIGAKYGAVKSSGVSAGFYFMNQDRTSTAVASGNWFIWRAKNNASNKSTAFLITPTKPNLMAITEDGNVGIGIDNPSERLVVKGKICAEEVRVSMNADPCYWPDYVFAKDYNLMPLPQLEAYIKANQHLPKVPAAGEVAKSGIEMGQMQATTLEKVEELTLYLIELKKENEEMKKRLEVLEANGR